jgi:uncharacterized membrane protein YphA (DoxX/SURF4 family)
MVGWVIPLGRHPEIPSPPAQGIGRFVKIGILAPQFFGPFVGVTEIVCGALLIVGLFTTWRCGLC